MIQKSDFTCKVLGPGVSPCTVGLLFVGRGKCCFIDPWFQAPGVGRKGVELQVHGFGVVRFLLWVYAWALALCFDSPRLASRLA